MKKLKFQTPTGMHDILPEDERYFQEIYKVVKEIADFYRFQKIETPILEDTELFSRGIGMATDIVQKEMFTFKTRGGDFLTLRPEGTAPIIRAYFQHGFKNLPQPVKLWYFSPFFRYERPQLGRFRQFWQFGFEVIGEESSVIDAQLILIFSNILKELGFQNLVLKINSLGDSNCRPYYRKVLTSYFKSKVNVLCQDCRRRLKENPLRILDCKEERCQQIVSQAPQILDYLCEACKAHFKEVLEFLEDLGISYYLDPFLVRGLDYYTRTVFEIFEEGEKGKAVGALAGGGRYDNLAKIIGDEEIPAAGGAGGIERIIILLKEKKMKPPVEKKPKVFLAQIGGEARKKALKLLEVFREAKIPVVESLGRDSLKSQMRVADALGVKYTLVLGQKEAIEGKILVKDMISGKQKIIPLKRVVSFIKKKI
jgi:histidyl-tRNA synthetase